MSAQGHSDSAEAAEHGYTYEGIPADKPQPDEPRSPGWLPLLGVGIVLSILLAYVVTRPPGKAASELQPEAGNTVAEPAPAEPARAPRPPGRPPGARGQAAPAGDAPPALSGALRRLARPPGAPSGAMGLPAPPAGRQPPKPAGGHVHAPGEAHDHAH